MAILKAPSYNAICQAVKVLVPEITREAHRAVCGYPNCFTATNRYWRETYNIKPWDKRTKEEQGRALNEAWKLVRAAAHRGIHCPRVDRLIREGKIDKPTEEQLYVAGYKYHHTAFRQGYCCVDLIGTVKPYCGRFGSGFIRRLGRGGRNYDSTVYEAISYWVR